MVVERINDVKCLLDQDLGRPARSARRGSTDRIRFQPSPGTTTVQDVIDVQRREGKLCELIEGVLVEKTVRYSESRLAGLLLGLLNWEINPLTRTVAAYTSTTQAILLTATDTLGGGTVLVGFTLPLQQLFAEMDREG